MSIPDQHLAEAERRSRETFDRVRSSYDLLHERVAKVATLLMTGAGAAGSFALGKLGDTSSEPVAWLPLAGLALSWFVCTAFLARRGLWSGSVSDGPSGKALLNQLEHYRQQGKSDDEAYEAARRHDIELAAERIQAYRDGCSRRSRALNSAYFNATVLSPGAAIVLIYFALR